MLGMATTGHTTTGSADLARYVRMLAAHQITVEHVFETGAERGRRPRHPPQLLSTGGPR